MAKDYKLEIQGGRLNGADRYYSSLGSAIRAAKSIIRADERSYLFNTYIEIFYLQHFAPCNCRKTLAAIVQ